MATLSIPKNYVDGTSFFESDLDDIRDNITTFMNTPNVESDNIQTGGIDGQTDIKILSITGDKLAASFVDDSTLEISSNAVQVKDSGITTAKIDDGAVTLDKLNTLTLNQSANVLSTAGSGSFATVASQSITTTGRPVVVRIASTSTGSGEGKALKSTTGRTTGTTSITDTQVLLRFTRDGTDISGQYESNFDGASSDPDSFGGTTQNSVLTIPIGLFFIDQPSAGTYTYALQLNAGAVATVNDLRLEVFEIY